MSAFYDRSSFTVHYVRATRRVDRIVVYDQWALLRFPGGFEPMLAVEADVQRWLGAHHPDLPVIRAFREIDVPALGLKFVLNEGCDPTRPPPPLRWVESLEFRAPPTAP